MLARWNIFSFFLILTSALTFSGLSAQTLCTDPQNLKTTDSCSKPAPGYKHQRRAQYEFSMRTLKLMYRIASGTNSPVKAEIAEILNRMKIERTDGVGFFYDVHIVSGIRHNSDCNFYARSKRGSLNTGKIIFSIGGQDCSKYAVSLLILYGIAIDHLTTRSAASIGKYYFSNHPNLLIASNCAVTPYSEILSIMTYHQITREQLIAASSVIAIDVIEVSIPTVKYIVKAGDSMYGIARQETGVGDNWKTIWALNSSIADPGSLVDGQLLNIPPRVSGWEAQDSMSSDYPTVAAAMEVDFMSKDLEVQRAGWGSGDCGVIRGMERRLVPIIGESQETSLGTLWLPKLKGFWRQSGKSSD